MIPACSIVPVGSNAGTTVPKTGPTWIKPIYSLRFDLDMVEEFGLKACRFICYLECWLRGKVNREPEQTAYTYDPATVICERTGLKPPTLERIVKKLRRRKFIRIKHGSKNVRHYAFANQQGYFTARTDMKHLIALREDADRHGEPVAILLANLRYWTKQNPERKRLFQGRYWRHDTLKQLVKLFSGFLTPAQVKKAFRYMKEQQLVDVIAFYDANGVRQDDKFWIALLEIPPVADDEPNNKVRPACHFTVDGKLLDRELEAPNERFLDDKTGFANDLTAVPSDKTESTENSSQVVENPGDTAGCNRPLIVSHLFVPPALAPARASFTQTHLLGNLPQSAESARPSASRQPMAASAESPTPGAFFGLSSPELEELKVKVEILTRQVQHLTLHQDLEDSRLTRHESRLESQQDLLLRIAKPQRRNFTWQFRLDFENAVKQHNKSNDPLLEDEIPLYKNHNTPRVCFAREFGNPGKLCNHCAWAKSCEIGTPADVKDAFQHLSILKAPEGKALPQLDRPETVADTYRTVYQEVFGIEAPDSVGKPKAIYQHAQSLKITVQDFCRIFMSNWANTHPKQTFYARFLSGNSACETVQMALELCGRKYGTASDIHLALLLGLKFHDNQPIWRHQTTPTERFMDGWRAVCKEGGQPNYEFAKPEIQELCSFVSDMRVRDIQQLLSQASEWISETEGAKTLMHFLCHIQGKPVPELETEIPAVPPPHYECLIDEEEGVHDVKRTRAYREEETRKQEAERAARPDSGPEYLGELLQEPAEK